MHRCDRSSGRLRVWLTSTSLLYRACICFGLVCRCVSGTGWWVVWGSGYRRYGRLAVQPRRDAGDHGVANDGVPDGQPRPHALHDDGTWLGGGHVASIPTTTWGWERLVSGDVSLVIVPCRPTLKPERSWRPTQSSHTPCRTLKHFARQCGFVRALFWHNARVRHPVKSLSWSGISFVLGCLFRGPCRRQEIQT